MKKLPFLSISIIFCCFISKEAFSQKFLGIATQYNGSFYSAYQNPAFLADNRYNTRLHVLSGGMHLDNNYAYYAAPFSIFDVLRKKNDRSLDPYDLVETGNDKPKNGTLSAELRGPAVSFSLGDKTNLAIMTRVRSGFQVNEVSNRLMAIARLGLANRNNLSDLGYLALFATNSENSFNMASQAYSEWAASIGQILIDNDEYRLKGGFTIKRYFGYAGGYVQNRELNYRLLPDESTVDGAIMDIDRFDATMGYTSADRTSFLSPGWLFGRNASGKGWGWDAGLSYEVLSEDEDIPKMRLSASVTDMGQIDYSGDKVKNYTIKAENKQITEEEWRSYSSPREGETQLSGFGRLMEEKFGLTDEDNTGSFSLATPAALNLSIDLRMAKGFYVSGTVIQAIKKTNMPQLRQVNLVAVTPRYETENFGLSFPIIRQNDGWAIGTGLRMGPLVLGSDNLLGIFSRNGKFKAQGVDVYGGLSLGLNPKQK